jgi:TrkA domain protein
VADIQEAELPGVGVRFDFSTEQGRRLGVIVHRSGDRELLVYRERDPDAVEASTRLELEDARTLAELLGAPHVTETMVRVQSVEGLSLDWLPVEPGAACAGRALRDTDLRSTGVSVVAVVREGGTIPSPDPDFTLLAGDTAVVVGTPEGLRRAFELLRGRRPDRP